MPNLRASLPHPATIYASGPSPFRTSNSETLSTMNGLESCPIGYNDMPLVTEPAHGLQWVSAIQVNKMFIKVSVFQAVFYRHWDIQ